MTPDLDLDDAPDLGNAQLRLDTAVQQLIQPGREQLDRDSEITSPAAREAATEERREHKATLDAAWARLRHAQAQRADAVTKPAAAAAARAAHAELRTIADLTTRQTAREQARTARHADLPSLLDQLLDAIPGGGDTDHGKGPTGAHRAALAFAALDLITDIQRTIGAQHRNALTADLRAWTERAVHWRASDPARLLAAATAAEGWVETGRAILTPPKRWTLYGACPACGARTAHVQDGDELVRRPALELDRATVSARCLRCGTRWASDKLPLLAAVLEQGL